MQFIISDIKRWTYSKTLFIAQADSSNLLYANNANKWSDWAHKFGLSNTGNKIPDGWFLIQTCCGNIKQAIWHLIIINKLKRVVKGWDKFWERAQADEQTCAKKLMRTQI